MKNYYTSTHAAIIALHRRVFPTVGDVKETRIYLDGTIEVITNHRTYRGRIVSNRTIYLHRKQMTFKIV